MMKQYSFKANQLLAFLIIFLFSTNFLLAQDTLLEVKPFVDNGNKLIPFSTGYLDKTTNYEMVSGQLMLIGYPRNRGFITFDLTKLPPGAIIKAAVFKISVGQGGNYSGLNNYATVTGLSNSSINGLITKKDIESGPVYGDKLYWGDINLGTPYITTDINTAGIAAIQKKLGSGFPVGINPPANTTDTRILSSPSLFITYTKTVNKSKPNADFSAYKNAYKKDTIRFTDNSGNYPSQWLWDFGDSIISTDKNPTHIYADTGMYTVKLKVANSIGLDSITKTSYMTIMEKQGPIADFVSDVKETFTDVPISFSDSSKYKPIHWKWYFGDGDSSLVKNPSHNYKTPGKFTITLIATNQYAPIAYPYSSIYISDTLIRKNYISVLDPSLGPVANFGFSNVTNFTIVFSDSSYNTPKTWLWDFDAKNNPGKYTSIDTNPTFIYPISGDYEICLIVSNDAGKDTVCRTISIIDSTTGIAALRENEIGLYPNPAKQIVNLQLPKLNEIYTVNIYSIFGEKIYQKTIDGLEKTMIINLDGFSDGCYFLNLKSANINTSKKLILNKALK